MIYPDASARVARYMDGLRNPAARVYATKIIRWLERGKAGQEPNLGGLAWPTAQAVRMNVLGYLTEVPRESTLNLPEREDEKK